MTNRPRKPWLASVLSLGAPGLGHLYCACPVRALFLLVLVWLPVPAAIAAALPPARITKVVLYGMSIIVALLSLLLAIADAFLAARNRREEFAPRRWQGPLAYGAFAALSLLALLSPVVVRNRVLVGYRTATGSMAPTLVRGDQFLASKLACFPGGIARGDVVVFHAPGKGQRVYVKRVVAVPGERVEVKSGRVLVDGTPVGPPVHGYASPAKAPFVLAPGRYFVLGDNLERSADSRFFGPVSEKAIFGRVLYRFGAGSLTVLPR